MMDFAAIGRLYGDRPLFIRDRGNISHAGFAAAVAVEREALDQSVRDHSALHALRLEWRADAFARFLGHLTAGHSVILGRAPAEVDLRPFLRHAPLLVLRTGGTTGAPRHVVHGFARFSEKYQPLERPPTRVLILYAPDHVAGLDAFFQCLQRGGTLLVPRDLNPGTVAEAIERQRVQVLPATPTFLQFLLLSGALDGRALDSVEVIPHGAEPMPPALRARLSKAFPRARLVQRFGMTELGALPVVPDPEDPEALLLQGENAPGKAGSCAWKVVDGELWISSPSRMLGTLEDGPVDPGNPWYRTGDLAELTPRGSIRILGRRESLINVGGHKVIPEAVEALLLEQPGVSDAAVYGIPSQLTGQAVAARVIFDGPADVTGLLKSLRAAARQRELSLAHVPTRIDPADHLDKTAIGKRARPRGKA
jgi:acyl-coenzyme A synthetase/AMP-(fatty) acid ligase